MTIGIRHHLTFLATATLALACSSGGRDPDDDSSGGKELLPGEPNDDEARYFATAQECDPLDSGYAGDEFCIQPPEEGEGFQLHYGPARYDDPDEVEPFLIYPGEEYVSCIFRKSPNQEEVWSGTYHSRLRPGSHHMITYLQPNEVADNTAPTVDCRMGVDFTFFVGATTLSTDLGMLGDTAPEDQGLGLHLPPSSQMVISLHYVNTSDAPMLKESWINAIYLPRDEVRGEVQPVTWIGGLAMAVPPRSKVVIQAGATAEGGSCSPSEAGTRIQQLVAHAHANTTRVSAFLKRPGDAERQLVYETYDWHDPGFLSYNTQAQNPAPDAASRRAGGMSGLLVVNPEDELSWECAVENDFEDVTLTFADRAYDAEMCNMFGVYETDSRQPWRCFTQ